MRESTKYEVLTHRCKGKTRIIILYPDANLTSININNNSGFLYSVHIFHSCDAQGAVIYSIFLQGLWDYVWIKRSTPFT